MLPPVWDLKAKERLQVPNHGGGGKYIFSQQKYKLFTDFNIFGKFSEEIFSNFILFKFLGKFPGRFHLSIV